MKSFRYSLEAVKEYKGRVLDDALSELAECMERLNRQERYLSALYMKRFELESSFRQLKSKGGAIQEFQLLQDMLDRRAEEIQMEEARLLKLQKEADEKKDKLLEAKVDVSKLDKLKEHQLSDYKKDEQRAEERFIEEFVAFGR